MLSDKRETGENPVRSRHCKWGVYDCGSKQFTGKLGRISYTWIYKSGNLPVVGTRIDILNHE